MNKEPFSTIKQQYKKLLADHITVSVEDLTDNELSIIEKSYELFQDKLDDIKVLNDEIKRLSIALLNLKAMTDNINNNDFE